MDEEERSAGFAIDLEALENHASDLYLHRFVSYVRGMRGTHGRYLVLRSGDETAIRAAGDGSSEILEDIAVDIGDVEGLDEGAGTA